MSRTQSSGWLDDSGMLLNVSKRLDHVTGLHVALTMPDEVETIDSENYQVADG